MASSKQNFLGLIKISGNQWETYNDQKALGKLIFADITTEGHVGKYIYANGVEYNVADGELIAALNASVADISAWKRAVENWIADTSVLVPQMDASIADLSTRMQTAEGDINALEADVADLSTRVKNLEDTSYVNTLTGDDYVSFNASTGDIVASIKIGDIATATVDASGLATAYDVSAFVMNQLGELSNALVFRGGVDGVKHTLPTTGQKTGDTYVATAAFDDQTAGVKADSGDLIIWNGSSWVVVERNLDGAVTSGDILAAGYIVQGAGNQAVATSTVSLSSLVDVSNNAVRTINANTSTADYLDAQAVKHDQTVDISYGVKIQEVSTAAEVSQGLADAKHVKDYVDAKAADIKVQATLNSSTPDYVDVSASVDEAGRVISASVGVKVATLADASNGSIGLAMAEDVYDELSKVEEVMATSVTKMKETLGLDDSLGVDWDPNSGIATDSTYKAAIEGAYKAAHEAVVTSFAGKTGDISLAPASQTAGDINLTISADGSVLSAAIVDLQGYVANAIDSSIKLLDVDSTEVANKVLVGVSETDGKVDSSAVALVINGQAFTHTVGDPSMTATISGLDISVSDIDTSTIAERIEAINVSVNALEEATYVRSVTGESDVLTNANDAYVNVSASTNTETGAVTLDSSVQLANPVEFAEGETHATPTGLATDGWVKDFLAWEVIGDDVEPEP